MQQSIKLQVGTGNISHCRTVDYCLTCSQHSLPFRSAETPLHLETASGCKRSKDGTVLYNNRSGSPTLNQNSYQVTIPL